MSEFISDDNNLRVSVIIPVYNAADTLAETLDLLCSQTHPYWEAIIVDDGSSDTSGTLARRYAVQDERIRYFQTDHSGVSAARNAGIAQARCTWIMFLDADDWLRPEYLARMTGVLVKDEALDAVHCGWARIDPEGRVFEEHPGVGAGDLSNYFRASCYFAIHACVVRTELIAAINGFDPSLQTCEDWDLWQRVTAKGARFGVVPDILAIYRTRPTSASLNAHRLLQDGFRVLERTHAGLQNLFTADPDRLPARSELDELLLKRRYLFLCWCAGLLIGKRTDARALLEYMPAESRLEFDPAEVAVFISTTILLPECRTPATGTDFWIDIAPQLEKFLSALEKRVGMNGLASLVINSLWRFIIKETLDLQPGMIGRSFALKIDIWEPIWHLHLPAEAERIFCRLEAGGDKLGVVELPVFDGLVPDLVLADAIAAECAWEILERFFRATIYPNLRVEKKANGLAVWRGENLLVDDLPDEVDSLDEHLHPRSGWTLFLQEVWGWPDKPLDWFYNPLAEDADPSLIQCEDGWLKVDVCERIPDVACDAESLQVAAYAGGAALGVLSIPAQAGLIKSAAIRSRVTQACGFELCRVAVREALLGKRFDAPGALYDRLAASRLRVSTMTPDNFILDEPPGAPLVDGWQQAAAPVLATLHKATLIPRAG